MVAFGQLENGCMCCSAEEDLMRAATQLLQEGGQLDHMVFECSGMAQPGSLLELFARAEEEGHPFTEHAFLDQVVTVVDARTLLKWLEVANGKTQVGVGEELDFLAELLVAQIECANVIILSKVDCVLQSQLAKCRAAIRALNSNALLECATFGDVPPSVLLGKISSHLRGRNSVRGRMQGRTPTYHNGHQQYNDQPDHDDHGHGGHHNESHEEHVTSFVYEARRPFHPKRLAGMLRSLRMQCHENFGKGPVGIVSAPTESIGRGLLRSKGLVWLATSMDKAREWAQVGSALHIHDGELWQATTPKEEWPAGDTGRKVEDCKTGCYGDRRQEIVFIGTGEMQETVLRDALNTCLLTLDEMKGGPDTWRELPDPIVLTGTSSAHIKGRPVTHGVGCTCCDPELGAIDQMVYRDIQ